MNVRHCFVNFLEELSCSAYTHIVKHWRNWNSFHFLPPQYEHAWVCLSICVCIFSSSLILNQTENKTHLPVTNSPLCACVFRWSGLWCSPFEIRRKADYKFNKIWNICCGKKVQVDGFEIKFSSKKKTHTPYTHTNKCFYLYETKGCKRNWKKKATKLREHVWYKFMRLCSMCVCVRKLLFLPTIM